MRRFIPILACAIVAACGGTSNGPTGPTAATVAVQSSDLPNGMVRCDISGEIQSFIQKEQSPDPATAKTLGSEWSAAQKSGATAAYAMVYTDSKGHCSDFASAGTNPGSVPYKLVINFALQFKDIKSAALSYTSGSVFGVSSSSLRAGSQAIEGTKTGLSANSVVVEFDANPAIYIALWQNQTFDLFLALLNFDPAAAKKVATTENSRIK